MQLRRICDEGYERTHDCIASICTSLQNTEVHWGSYYYISGKMNGHMPLCN